MQTILFSILLPQPACRVLSSLTLFFEVVLGVLPADLELCSPCVPYPPDFCYSVPLTQSTGTVFSATVYAHMRSCLHLLRTGDNIP